MNSIYFYHSDALGSVNYITDSKGSIAATYEYKTYGEPTIKDSTGKMLTGSAIGNPFMFTGREYDFETGLYYYRARYYNPNMGRFLQDPIGFRGGDLNLYAYVKNNPVNYRDPYGFWYVDIGVSIGWLGLAGISGVMIGPEGIYKYAGGGSGFSYPPGAGLSITWSPNDVKTGWNVGLQYGHWIGEQRGYSLWGEEKMAEPFWEIGLVTPGFSLTEFYVEQIYKWPWEKSETKDCKGH